MTVRLPEWARGGAFDSLTAMAQQAMPPSRFSDTNVRNMLDSRMGWNVSSPSCPFNRVYPVKLDGSPTIAVFVALKDKAVVIEDDANLYPSDALVTQLRLLGDK